MKNVAILLVELLLIVGLLVGIHSVYRQKAKARLEEKPLITNEIQLSSATLEEELTYFLATRLNLYEEGYEIVDVTNLATAAVTGTDYLVVTIRTPDGRYCQIAVSRQSVPWAKWELNPETYQLVDIRQPDSFSAQTPPWMREIGITAAQVEEYFAAHPELRRSGAQAFIDKQTGAYRLPADWYQAVKVESTFNVEVGKDKTMRIFSNIGEEARARLVNSYWKSDYPVQYLGPGYRGYLYKKIKGNE